MKHADREYQRLIKKAGGKLIRFTKHGPLYELPNGARISTSGSAGDARVLKNLKCQIRRALAQKKVNV